MTITTEKKEDGHIYSAGIATPYNSDKSTGFMQKYGYFEMKAILPEACGIKQTAS